MRRSVGEDGDRCGIIIGVSAEEKAQVATYASTHSVRAAIKYFFLSFFIGENAQ